MEQLRLQINNEWDGNSDCALYLRKQQQIFKRS